MWKRSFRATTSLKVWKLKMWKRSFCARRPSKSERWRCENEAFVQDIPRNLNVEDVKTKLSCETSLKVWKLKMWKRSFCARRPSKSESWSCESQAFVRDVSQNLNVEDVQTKLSCETYLNNWTLKMWKRTSRARHRSESASWRCECEAFVRDFPQSLQAEDVKTWSFRARRPSRSERWICENEAFVREFPQNLNVEDVKTKLSCKTSFRVCKLKMKKQSFRARLPQSLKAEDVKAKLSCETSLKILTLKMWERCFRARCPSESAEDVKTKLSCETSLRVCNLKVWKRSFRAWRPSKYHCWRCENEAFMRDFLQGLQAEDVKTNLSFETSLKVCKLKMWKRTFRARLPSKSESWRCENGAFMRDIPQSLKAEDVKMELSCETSLKVWKLKMWERSFRAGLLSLKVWKLKMWKRSFRARHLSKSASWRCENKAFVRDIPQSLQAEDEKNGAFVRAFLQSLQAEDVKTKLSCKTSFKVWKLKMWKRSFRARLPSKSERWRCENEAFVRDILQSLKAEDVKTKLSCETSLKVCKLKMWKQFFPARRPSMSASWRCENGPFVRDVL